MHPKSELLEDLEQMYYLTQVRLKTVRSNLVIIILLSVSLACNAGTFIDFKYGNPDGLSAERIMATQDAIDEEIFYEKVTATAYALEDLKTLATEAAAQTDGSENTEQDEQGSDLTEEGECAELTAEECRVLGTHTYSQFYEEFGQCRGDDDRNGPRPDADFTIGIIDDELALFSGEFGWDLTYEPFDLNTYFLETYADGVPDLRITLTLTGDGFTTESRKIADDSACLFWTRTLID